MRSSESYMSHYNRIAQRHLDFLLCKPNSMEPILGIELDDASHNSSKRKKREEFVNEAFEAAKLPLLRITAQRDYDPQELGAKIAQCLKKTKAPSTNTDQTDQSTTPEVTEENTTSPPLCPKCGVPMIIREAKRGKFQGRQFYGCPNYPNCREVLPVDADL